MSEKQAENVICPCCCCRLFTRISGIFHVYFFRVIFMCLRLLHQNIPQRGVAYFFYLRCFFGFFSYQVTFCAISDFALYFRLMGKSESVSYSIAPACSGGAARTGMSVMFNQTGSRPEWPVKLWWPHTQYSSVSVCPLNALWMLVVWVKYHVWEIQRCNIWDVIKIEVFKCSKHNVWLSIDRDVSASFYHATSSLSPSCLVMPLCASDNWSLVNSVFSSIALQLAEFALFTHHKAQQRRQIQDEKH